MEKKGKSMGFRLEDKFWEKLKSDSEYLGITQVKHLENLIMGYSIRKEIKFTPCKIKYGQTGGLEYDD